VQADAGSEHAAIATAVPTRNRHDEARSHGASPRHIQALPMLVIKAVLSFPEFSKANFPPDNGWLRMSR
jgi:hypothetical protein